MVLRAHEPDHDSAFHAFNDVVAAGQSEASPGFVTQVLRCEPSDQPWPRSRGELRLVPALPGEWPDDVLRHGADSEDAEVP